ncbi:MAG TPA: hypothetical protein VKF42_10350 [Chitinivibrionales bacterium]|jgi:hypothetical protein|nr:hypothetical protein [Chitinivibrionales bacterium]
MFYPAKFVFPAIVCFLFVSMAGAAMPPGYTGTPYAGDTLLGKPQQIPGVVKEIFVDVGGGNVTTQAYSNWDYDCLGYGTNGQPDSSVNATHQTSHLAYMNQGLNPEYTVHVNTAGTYYVDFKLANVNAPPNLITLTYYNGTKVQKDSVKNLPAVVLVVPPPGGVTEIWHNWTVNFNVDSIALDTGLQVVQITFAQGAWNSDWARFRLKGGTDIRTAAPVHAGPAGLKAEVIANGRLAVSCNAAGPVRISLMDCAGRTVVTAQERFLSAGTHELIIPFTGAHRGIYVLRLEQNGISTESRFLHMQQ